MDPAGDTDKINGMPTEEFTELAAKQIASIIYTRWVRIMNNFDEHKEDEHKKTN